MRSENGAPEPAAVEAWRTAMAAPGPDHGGPVRHRHRLLPIRIHSPRGLARGVGTPDAAPLFQRRSEAAPPPRHGGGDRPPPPADRGLLRRRRRPHALRRSPPQQPAQPRDELLQGEALSSAGGDPTLSDPAA